MMIKLYILSKQIHRLLVFVMTILLLVMSITGLLLKYTFIADKFPFIDTGYVRYLHNNTGPYFTVVLSVMLLSGLYMYLFLVLRRKTTR